MNDKETEKLIGRERDIEKECIAGKETEQKRVEVKSGKELATRKMFFLCENV
jgi:hypothetical protein